MKRILYFLFICCLPFTIIGNNQIDLLLEKAGENSENNLDSAFHYSFTALDIAIELDDWNLAGKIAKTPLYMQNGEQFESYLANHKGKNLEEEIVMLHQQMRYYVAVTADFDKSFEYLIQLRQALDDKKGNILYPVIMGDVYYIAYWIKHVQHDLVKSREYAQLLAIHAEKYEMTQLMYTAKLGIAELDHHNGEYKSAISQFVKLESTILQDSDSTMANRLYSLLSNVYTDVEKHDSALYYGRLAYNYIPDGNTQLKAFNSIHVARGYLINNQADSAIIFGENALKIVEELGVNKEIKDLNQFLAEAYKSDANYELALAHLETYLAMEQEQASLMSAANISNLEAELTKEKNAVVFENEQAKVVARDLKIEKKNLQMYGLIALIILIIIIAILAIRVYLIKKKDAEIIRKQKVKVEEAYSSLEEAHTEISDSIKYAERLQLAILPSVEDLRTNLKNGFVLFQPKDVVSGDFYWMQNVGETVLFAAADCTGHGVPGAMVSVVCSNALNRTVNEFGITAPNEILNKTRELVIETFARSGKDIKDGMDIALCSMTGRKLIFSGANNPLWIMRKTDKITSEEKEQRSTVILEDYGIIECKGTKQPIGLYENMKDFEQTEIELLVDDSIFLFTDGYADQFGGIKDKKLMYKPFKKLLLSNYHLSMEEQKQALNSFFEEWRGKNEQVDDVCIIGVRM
ncbi:MAG: serine phosphatase RsbU (regulator of sigma subunit) [Flavobacteriales bacterium]|jgi:serine phosphatase RsbU (regulator of sigma subunit)